MGDRAEYQPLTRQDRMTVRLYRAGIVLATACVVVVATGLAVAGAGERLGGLRGAGAALAGLFGASGVSVFFIHLYMSSFHRLLKRLYAVAAVCFLILLYLGGGNPAQPVATAWYGPVLLIPLSLCLGFVTAKEAFCFQLFEGYLVAMVMPLFLLGMATGLVQGGRLEAGLLLIAALLVLFTLRKVFQPLHYDIGDKSAYR